MRFCLFLLLMIPLSGFSQILEEDQGKETRCWDSKWHEKRFCEIYPTPGDTMHVVKYTESRNFVMREEFIDSVRNGKLVHWNMTPGGDTVKVYEVSFKGGRRDGLVREWHLNGRLKSEGHYDNNSPIGTWTSYLESGIKQQQVKFDEEGGKETLYTFEIPDTTLAKLDTILKYRLGEDLYENSSILGGNTVKAYGQNVRKFSGRQFYTKEVSINLPVKGGGFIDYTFEVEISTFGQLLTDLDDVIPNCAEDEKYCTVIPRDKAKDKKHPGGKGTRTSTELEMYNKKLVWQVRHVVDEYNGVKVMLDATRGRVLVKEDFVPIQDK